MKPKVAIDNDRLIYVVEIRSREVDDLEMAVVNPDGDFIKKYGVVDLLLVTSRFKTRPGHKEGKRRRSSPPPTNQPSTTAALSAYQDTFGARE